MKLLFLAMVIIVLVGEGFVLYKIFNTPDYVYPNWIYIYVSVILFVGVITVRILTTPY